MALSLNRPNRLRIRRIFRRQQKQVENATQQVEAQVETNLIGRFDRLLKVRRFAAGWILLAVLILVCTILQTIAQTGYYQTLKPVAGGIYNEGIVGKYSNASPLYASGAVDTAVSRLLFASLLTYNNKNELVGDLANSYSVDQTGKIYTVTLRSHLTWQDGQPLTANDVAFTYHTIQNPDANSPLLASWRGISIVATSPTTVTFTLPNVLSSFSYSLTTGIIPEHLLANIPAAQLRSSDFNTIHPVGAGPFAWQAIQIGNNADPTRATTFVALQPFKHYYQGAPKLDGFVVRAYSNEDQLTTAFKNRDINAMAGLIDIPSDLTNESSLDTYSFNSTAALMTLFKTSSGVLSDVTVRQALIKGADTSAIIGGLPYATKAVHEPLLSGQLAYDPKYQQARYNPAAAEAQLEAAGWVKSKDGLRSKAGVALAFHLYTQDNSENNYVATALAKDWRKIGVNVSVISQQLTDFQTTLEFHTYDALLYGVSLGVDPDVYAYWDSSQADIRSSTRLNFSEYKSTAADASIEAGRTRIDPALRVVKYRSFLEAWQTDAPALGLYQPRFLYITRNQVYGLNEHTLNTDNDRYNSVAQWEIHTARVTN